MSRINKESIDRLYDYDIYIPTRTIYMGSLEVGEDGEESGTDAKMAERAIKGLHVLDSSAPDGTKPITIILNSPGGDVYHGLAIYDAIKACTNQVTIIVYGAAMSMGSVILQAADKRVMSANAKLMVHYGEFSIDSHSKSTMVWAKEEERNNLGMENMFLEKIRAKNPKFTRKQLQDMLNFDTILSAEEAIKLGLADEIL
jgi:ATP-dependent Clp protease protease subunit